MHKFELRKISYNLRLSVAAATVCGIFAVVAASCAVASLIAVGLLLCLGVIV